MFNNKNPLALPALALIAGIFTGSGLEIGSSAILWISITLFFIVVLLFIFANEKSLSQKFTFIIISFFIIGFLKIGVDTNKEVSVIKDNNYLSEEDIVVSGVALENPAIKKKRMTFIANLDSIYLQSRIFPINEKAIVNVRIDSNDTTIKNIKYGDKIFAVGKFLKPRDLRNPGEFNYAEYLKLQDINVFFNVKSTKCIITVSGGNGNYIQQSIIQPLRQYIGESVDEIFSGSEASFLKGLLIGDRSELTKDVKESFLNAGVMHVLAVSGLNVAFVIIIFSGLYSIFVPLRQLRTVLIIISLLIYMMVSGSSPSIVRATIMGIVFITGAGIERKTSAMNMLAVSAIIILLIDSRELFDLGFQLSFLCVFALIYFYPVLSALFVNYGLNKPLRWLLNSILGSIAVLIMLFPVLASAAGKVSIISIIANLFVVPLANLSLAVGFMQIIFRVISTSLMQTISEANRLFLFLNLSITEFFGSLKYSYIEIYFTKYSTAIYYLCVFAVFYFIRQKKYNILLIFSVLLITIFSWSAILRSGGDKLKIVFFDVGQGDACLITTTNGKNILIDSGPAKDDYDSGEKVIYPYLMREGIKNIDLCFISHFHDDHYGGLPYLIKKKMVKSVYYQDTIGSNKIFSCLDSLAKVQLAEFSRISFSDTLIDGLKIYVLSNKDNIKNNYNADIPINSIENNSSMVIKAVYGKISILFTGDIEIQTEERLVKKYADFLKSDVLKTAHHGSKSSSSEDFIEKVSPQYAVIFAASGNRFGFPSKKVTQRLSKSKTFVTGENGAVIFYTDGKEIEEYRWK